MSWYRFARATVLLQLGRKYRRRLLRILFALGLALTTSWAYPDVAALLAERAPQWALTALLLKTLVIYGGFVAVFWELSQILAGRDGQSVAKPRRPAQAHRASASVSAPASAEDHPAAETRPLDQLARKPKLRSRRERILNSD